MKYSLSKKGIFIENDPDFDVAQTLECGQCFNFTPTDTGYKIKAFSKVLNISIEKEGFILHTGEEEFKNTWYNYFDLDTDYGHIKEEICKNDAIMQEAVAFAPGIRILEQDRWECLLSFIISQNNNIPRIKKIINTLSEKYGKKQGVNYFFPELDTLKYLKEEDFFALKTGFRAKYLYDCVQKINSGELDIYHTDTLSDTQLLTRLKTVKGVGDKVANCVMLFSMGRKSVFPVDVWVKRVMETLYFKGEDTKKEDIENFAKEKWGAYAGVAQQYLFAMARERKIGVKSNR
ncbi:MAG: DNA-3-methyladenine glycosylase 2 family protein [Firmicutes bacterium]|nr:DNA-3-methyladenine glycosylase 2 family protein [Bacillota bacterium]